MTARVPRDRPARNNPRHGGKTVNPAYRRGGTTLVLPMFSLSLRPRKVARGDPIRAKRDRCDAPPSHYGPIGSEGARRRYPPATPSFNFVNPIVPGSARPGGRVKSAAMGIYTCHHVEGGGGRGWGRDTLPYAT
jgi:hypothetical protein